MIFFGFMQNVTPCPYYPPHNYTLVVEEDSEGNSTDPISQTAMATGSLIRIGVSDLMENTYYLYHVMATNQFGSSHQSTSMGIGMFLTFFDNLILIVPSLSHY